MTAGQTHFLSETTRTDHVADTIAVLAALHNEDLLVVFVEDLAQVGLKSDDVAEQKFDKNELADDFLDIFDAFVTKNDL